MNQIKLLYCFYNLEQFKSHKSKLKLTNICYDFSNSIDKNMLVNE